jgi:hypothetical protein
MSDVNEIVVEPILQFFKDSAYLVKMCTKPDAKGKIYILIIIRIYNKYCIWI